MQSSLLRLEQEDGENESSCTQRGSAWQCGLNKPRFKCGRGGTGQNITVLGQRDSLSFVHPLSMCPSWGRGVLNSPPVAWFKLASLSCLASGEQLRGKQALPIWTQHWR